MAKKRTLKAAVADPLAKKVEDAPEDYAGKTAGSRPAVRIGYAVIAAAVVAGVVGSWLARKYFRLF